MDVTMDVIKYFLSSERPPAAVAGAGGGKGAQLPLRHILGISIVDPTATNQPLWMFPPEPWLYMAA